MPSVSDIREGLAANLAAITGTQISAYMLDNPSPGMLQVAGVESLDYLRTMGDDATYTFIVEGCASLAAGDKGSQRRFDEWLQPVGATSVRAALEADRRLTKRLQGNGNVATNQSPAADDLIVREFRGYRRHRLPNNTEVLLGDWVVQVETSS